MHEGDEIIRDCWIKHDGIETPDLVAVHVLAGPYGVIQQYDLKLVMGPCILTLPGLSKKDINNLGSIIREMSQSLAG